MEEIGCAAEAAMARLKTEIGWTREVARELSRANARVAELRDVTRRLIALMPEAERAPARQRLATLIANGRRSYDKAEQCRAAAVDAYLQESASMEITPRDLERALMAQGFPIPDKRYASRVLSRKVQQGVVKRVGRGVYRPE